MHFDTKSYLKSNRNHTAKQSEHRLLRFYGVEIRSTLIIVSSLPRVKSSS
jgi:hypothetical protein